MTYVQLALRGVAAYNIVMYVLLRFRLLPVPVMRAWFTGTLAICILASGALTFLADSLRHLGVARKITQRLCSYCCVVTFRYLLYSNPHIRIRVDTSRLPWNAIPEPSAMIINHTSFFDAFVFIGNAPASYLYNCRTLMKSSLRSIPIFGKIFDRVGHFPVYFKSSQDGDFSVDKDKQAEVAVRVSAHLNDKGRIALFPEGAINKEPKVLKPFRFGTFATIFEHRLPVYFFIAVGNNESWPASAGVGGYPADIDCVIAPFAIDFDKEDPKDVAQRLQKEMQSRLDQILEKRRLRGVKTDVASVQMTALAGEKKE